MGIFQINPCYTIIITLAFIVNTYDLHAQRINVLPEKAVLKDSLKNEISKAPIDFTTLKPEVLYKISMAGYDDMVIAFAKTKSGIVFPQDLKNCDPCLAEFKGSPFDEDVELNMTLRLRKKVGERRNAIMLGVISPRIDIPKESVVAMVNGKKIKLSNDDIHLTMGYAHNLTHPLLGGLANNYLDVYDFEERRKDPTRLYSAKIVVKPVIKALSYRLEGKILREYKGPASIVMDWQYYYADDTTKMLGSITTKTSIYRNAPDLNLPVHLLIYEAASDLSANDTLFNYLDRLERTYLTGKYSQPTILAQTSELTFPSQKEMLRHVSQAVVTILNDEGFGSGVLIDPSGIILTSHHVVIDDTSGLRVRISGIEDPLPAKIKILNSDYDLALIELPPGKYNSIPLHTRTTLDIGDVVFAIGTPINQTLGQSVTKGIVSGFRTLNGVNFIQTDVSINSGNSGGALVSESGYLMGISTMKAKGRGIEGLGFCIPSATIQQALQFKYK